MSESEWQERWEEMIDAAVAEAGESESEAALYLWFRPSTETEYGVLKLAPDRPREEGFKIATGARVPFGVAGSSLREWVKEMSRNLPIFPWGSVPRGD